jgi:DinB family protein
MTDLRYPIGKFEYSDPLSPELRAACIEQIAAAPGELRRAVQGLTPAQLDTPYRPGGWTVRQVVHHLPDSHVNAYVRIKLALTEDVPTIKAYNEKAWAETSEAKTGDVETSLVLLESLHRRWVTLLRSMTPKDFRRELKHPESGRQAIDRLVAMYAWHGRHHVGHITGLRQRSGI